MALNFRQRKQDGAVRIKDAARRVLLIGLLTKFGLDGSAIEQWLHASVGWVSEHLDSAQRYLASLLPSATAAGAGSVMGYRRKRR
jgi:hypothetical protein